MEGVPALVVFGMADPDREIVADPASREQPGQRVGRGMLAHELAGLDRSDSVIPRCTLVEGAEEGNAAVGIVFPAVLAVEDHRNDRCGALAAGVTDGVQLAEEVTRGHGAGTALVVEADLVRHGMIAEEDRQLVITLACLPGSIKQLGMSNVAPAVAPDLAPRRAAQDLLIGRDPLDSMLSQQGNKGLADRALAGPHAPGSRPEPR